MDEKKQLSPAQAAGSIRNLILLLTQKQMPEYVELLNPLTDDQFSAEAAAKKLHIELTYAAVAGSIKVLKSKLGAQEAAAAWQAHKDQVKAKDIIAGYAAYHNCGHPAERAQVMIERIGVTSGADRAAVLELLETLINFLSNHPVDVLLKNANVTT